MNAAFRKNLLIITGLIFVAYLIQFCTLQSKHPVRDFLFNEYAENDSLGAYGYLLLSQRPMESDTIRYNKICEAFIGGIRPIDKFSQFHPSRIMVTYWPLANKPDNRSKLDDCRWLIQHYDYVKAEVILSTIEKNHVSGPLIVAWEKPFSPDSLYDNYLRFDLSKFNDKDLDRGIRIWKRQIIKGPEDWQKGLLYVRLKEELRNFLEKYGETIFAYVQ